MQLLAESSSVDWHVLQVRNLSTDLPINWDASFLQKVLWLARRSPRKTRRTARRDVALTSQTSFSRRPPRLDWSDRFGFHFSSLHTMNPLRPQPILYTISFGFYWIADGLP